MLAKRNRKQKTLTLRNFNQFSRFLSDDLPTRTASGSKTKDEKTQKDAFSGIGCPLCDSSVYSYCDFKIYHDACW